MFSGLATKSCETAAWSSFGQVAAKGTHRTEEGRSKDSVSTCWSRWAVARLEAGAARAALELPSAASKSTR